jgi:hypothetical protein
VTRLQIAHTDRRVRDGNAGNIGDRSTPACIEPTDAKPSLLIDLRSSAAQSVAQELNARTVTDRDG